MMYTMNALGRSTRSRLRCSVLFCSVLFYSLLLFFFPSQGSLEQIIVMTVSGMLTLCLLLLASSAVVARIKVYIHAGQSVSFWYSTVQFLVNFRFNINFSLDQSICIISVYRIWKVKEV